MYPLCRPWDSNDRLGGCCFRCREAPSPVGCLKCGKGSFLLSSCVTYASSLLLSQSPSMTLSLWLIQELDYFLSFSQCYCYLYWSILWKNKGVQLCRKQLFGEEKHMYVYRGMMSCESSSQTSWHWMSQTEGTPNIQRWNVTVWLNCFGNWGQLSKIHFKMAVLKCIRFKTTNVGHPYRVT